MYTNMEGGFGGTAPPNSCWSIGGYRWVNDWKKYCTLALLLSIFIVTNYKY